MKGELVVVRGFRDEASVVRVWDETAETIFVTAPTLTETADGPWPIGFARRDVYRYDAAAVDLLAAGHIDWGNLSTYELRSQVLPSSRLTKASVGQPLALDPGKRIAESLPVLDADAAAVVVAE